MKYSLSQLLKDKEFNPPPFRTTKQLKSQDISFRCTEGFANTLVPISKHRHATLNKLNRNG